jgi:hypothetical protein
MSYLVLAGEYVYKANTPVHFDLADCSTLGVRPWAAERAHVPTYFATRISRILGASLRELRSLLARLGTSLPACVCSGRSAKTHRVSFSTIGDDQDSSNVYSRNVFDSF